MDCLGLLAKTVAFAVFEDNTECQNHTLPPPAPWMPLGVGIPECAPTPKNPPPCPPLSTCPLMAVSAKPSGLVMLPMVDVAIFPPLNIQ